ncbi:MAG: GTP cyclohydrolase MptA [Methanomassiliicoccales archaeon]|nr:GTP cyclohydrolase MptA [Methanomassiliicoccales archaeon]
MASFRYQVKFISTSDVQNRRLTNGFKLTRVGVTGVKKPVTVRRGEKTVTLTCDIDVFVDLPSSQKGSHMSRNLEVIAEVVDQSVREPVTGLETLSANICRSLLERHEYASYSEVNLKASYFLERTGPSGRKTLEAYKLVAKAVNRRNNGLKKLIGVEVVGMTTCPCAMETLIDEFGSNVDADQKRVPMITHNQRNVTTVMIEVPEEYDVEANDLIDIVEESVSSPTYEILKRSEEAKVVLAAHENPKFVEDVVREILARVLEKYKHLPDEVMVTVRSESEESIHKHNAFAERVTTMKELRE